MANNKISLRDFSVDRGRRGPVCAVCLLDPEIRDQIDEAVREGARTVIVEWAEQVYPELHITVNKLDHHKKSKHHLGE